MYFVATLPTDPSLQITWKDKTNNALEIILWCLQIIWQVKTGRSFPTYLWLTTLSFSRYKKTHGGYRFKVVRALKLCALSFFQCAKNNYGFPLFPKLFVYLNHIILKLYSLQFVFWYLEHESICSHLYVEKLLHFLARHIILDHQRTNFKDIIGYFHVTPFSTLGPSAIKIHNLPPPPILGLRAETPNMSKRT